MSEPRRFSYGGVPVYNPQALSKEEAIAQFQAPQGVYQSLIDLLGEERPSHVLIIGTRGMGKTTLLQRVRYGVEDSPELSSRYLVLSFPEEQYNVNRIHHFLLNTVDAVADAMEQVGNVRMLERVEAYAARVERLTREQIEEDVPKFLAEVTEELQRNLLLLVDNADRLFETIEDREQWRMRELLSNRRDLTFIGATTQASEGIYGPDRAFFEFFKIVRLAPLTLGEVRTLLLRFSESVEEKPGEEGTAKRRVEEWLAADPARLRTLVQLTGGNPRTTVLLFHLVMDGLVGGAREYLEQLLDQCTPNYKGRVDDLPPQVQQVLDALALQWDPATALEIAEVTGLETNVVSTYLTRLVRQGLVEKVDPGDSKKALYQIAERFFNIWYLMRASRRVRARLRWFIEFLRVFFDSGELERLHRFRRTGLAGASEDEAEQAFRKAIEVDPKSAWAWIELGNFLAETPRRLNEAEAAFGQAAEVEPDSGNVWGEVGWFLACRARQPGRAETALRKSIELEPNANRALRNFGVLLFCELGNEEEGLEYVRKARHPDPTDRVSPAVATAILAACLGGSGAEEEHLSSFLRESQEPGFWSELQDLCRNYAPFGKILLRLCDLVGEGTSLHRAVALAQLGEFPRASVALEDALAGDPIDLLSWGRAALETFFAAAVRNGRVRDCLELIEKKEWIDAWRPIYEALKSVEAGSGDHLKRVAVEIRGPTQIILQRIAPELPGLAAKNS